MGFLSEFTAYMCWVFFDFDTVQQSKNARKIFLYVLTILLIEET